MRMRFIDMGLFKRLFHRSKQARYEQYKTKTVKVLVMGKSGVGKTSVIRKLCDFDDLLETYAPTCYDVHQKNVLVDEYNVTMQFMDLGGSQVFPSMQDVFIKQADIFLLVYSANDAESFHRLIEIRNLIVSLKNKHSTELPIVVVRNKTDLRKKHSKNQNIRKKSVHQWCYLVHDVSAKSGLKINAIMDSLIEESKFIGNSDLGSAKISGRYIYNERLGDVTKKEQYHKPTTMFHKPDNSDAKMEKRRRKSLQQETNKAFLARRSNSVGGFSTLRKKKLSSIVKSPEEKNPESSHTVAKSPESGQAVVKSISIESASRKSVSLKSEHSSADFKEQNPDPKVPNIELVEKEFLPVPGQLFYRKKSLSSNDLSLGAIQSLQKKTKVKVISQSHLESDTEIYEKPVTRPRCSTFDGTRRSKTKKIDIVHTTLPTDLPDDYTVPIYYRSQSSTSQKLRTKKSTTFEEIPELIYPVPAWRSSGHSMLWNKTLSNSFNSINDSGMNLNMSTPPPTSRLYNRRKSVSVNDLSSIHPAKKLNIADHFINLQMSEESVSPKLSKRKISSPTGWADKRKAFRAKKMSLINDSPKNFSRKNTLEISLGDSLLFDENKNINNGKLATKDASDELIYSSTSDTKTNNIFKKTLQKQRSGIEVTSRKSEYLSTMLKAKNYFKSMSN